MTEEKINVNENIIDLAIATQEKQIVDYIIKDIERCRDKLTAQYFIDTCEDIY